MGNADVDPPQKALQQQMQPGKAFGVFNVKMLPGKRVLESSAHLFPFPTFPPDSVSVGPFWIGQLPRSTLTASFGVDLPRPVQRAHASAYQLVFSVGRPTVGSSGARRRALELGHNVAGQKARSCAASFPGGAQSTVCTRNPPNPPLCSANRLIAWTQSSGVPTIQESLSTMKSMTFSSGPVKISFRPFVPSEYSRR